MKMQFNQEIRMKALNYALMIVDQQKDSSEQSSEKYLEQAIKISDAIYNYIMGGETDIGLDDVAIVRMFNLEISTMNLAMQTLSEKMQKFEENKKTADVPEPKGEEKVEEVQEPSGIIVLKLLNSSKNGVGQKSIFKGLPYFRENEVISVINKLLENQYIRKQSNNLYCVNKSKLPYEIKKQLSPVVKKEKKKSARLKKSIK